MNNTRTHATGVDWDDTAMLEHQEYSEKGALASAIQTIARSWLVKHADMFKYFSRQVVD